MTAHRYARGFGALGCCAALTVSGCGFQGVNSLPLPGVKGRGANAALYHVEIENVATLESNSPVLINDVVVGSVGKMTVDNWHADVEAWVNPDVVVPANVVAKVGQTSLLGSMHLSLDTPLGQEPQGRLQSGATIGLNKASTYPTTEQTLSSLSVVVNGGGLGQLGDIVSSFNATLGGREPQIRDLLSRLDRFIGTLSAQRDNLVATIENLNRFSGTLAAQRDVITEALRKIPPALEVLNRERPRLTTALTKLGEFSDTASAVVTESKDDLVNDLRNLTPAIKALADVGPDLDVILAYALFFPYTQTFIDRGIRGDYYNLFADIDLTIPRLKRALFLGTRFGQEGAALTPAPGDPQYLNYTYDPLMAGITQGTTPLPAAGGSAPPASAPANLSAGQAPPPAQPQIEALVPPGLRLVPADLPPGVNPPITGVPQLAAAPDPAAPPPPVPQLGGPAAPDVVTVPLIPPAPGSDG
ncbi:MCE family protein [Mycobacterium sp. MYCO198283]|uniref:MCE family protein n=1 Tax=Mycobacterium sp. MYCO198283 TaxID=2883505 RepID=UPI001E333AA8|nr:MCE family protein [Mycobacterium sp. MYCO198283]MCG5434172.1 MCE family protein [Mycobacterium sp. MYCO198283]